METVASRSMDAGRCSRVTSNTEVLPDLSANRKLQIHMEGYPVNAASAMS
jgi:hypothetical protein